MPIKLYVDNISNEGRTGYTCDSSKIYFNFEHINKQWFEDFLESVSKHNTSSAIFTAGRFLGIISITFDKGGQEMILMDLKNDEQLARGVQAQRENQEEMENFMSIFYSLSKLYERDYYKFELMEGLPQERPVN